ISSLRGRPRQLERFSSRRLLLGAFDFDGTRATWTEQRIDRIRTRCPPAGVGMPCSAEPIGPIGIFVARGRH
ncbi:MAG: hypothetical protein ACR2ML_12700, partial [Solirubrobacteraceae bacterium]